MGARKAGKPRSTKGKPAQPEPRSGCPIAISLDLFGDRWSLLIVRDLMFRRPLGYSDFAGAPEGIATNILADRLARLEGGGIITRVPDPRDGRKVLYSLTDKGLALAPVLAEMVAWAATHEQTEAPAHMVAQLRADHDKFVTMLKAGWTAGNQASPHP